MSNDNDIAEKKLILNLIQPNDLAKYTIILAAICFACYFNILFNDFTYNDHTLIKDNKYIKSLGAVFKSVIEPAQAEKAKIGEIETFQGFIYRPMSFFIMFIIGKIFGISPLPFHLFNIIFHILNCTLVFLLCLRLKIKEKTSLLIASIFATHPIHTDAVSSAVGIQEELVFLFGLSAILILITKIPYKFIIAFLLFSATLFAKENGVIFAPIFIGIILYLYVNSEKEFLQTKNLLKLSIIIILPLIIYFYMRYSILGSFIRYTPIPKLAIDNPLHEQNAFARILTSIFLFSKYLLMFILPVNLSADYSLNSIEIVKYISDLRFIASLIVMIIMIYLFIYLIKKNLYLFALGIFIFYVSLIPVSNLLFNAVMLFAEHNLYLPSLGLCIILGSILRYFLQSNSRSIQKGVYFITIIMILSMVIATFSRNTVWKDDMTLFSNVAKIYPNNARAQYNLGVLYYNQGKYSDAISHFTSAAKIHPILYNAYLGIIYSYSKSNNFAQAIGYATEALKIFPKDEQLYDLLAKLYKQSANPEKTKQIYIEAIEKTEKSYILNYNLAADYFSEGNYKEAEKYFKKAINANDNPKVHLLLGECYYKQHKDKEAIEEFNKILPFAKEYPEVIKYLIILYLNRGEYSKSEDLALTYIKLVPQDAEGYALASKISWKVYEEYKAARKYMEIAKSYDPNICKNIDYLTLCISLGLE